MAFPVWRAFLSSPGPIQVRLGTGGLRYRKPSSVQPSSSLLRVCAKPTVLFAPMRLLTWRLAEILCVAGRVSVMRSVLIVSGMRCPVRFQSTFPPRARRRKQYPRPNIFARRHWRRLILRRKIMQLRRGPQGWKTRRGANWRPHCPNKLAKGAVGRCPGYTVKTAFLRASSDARVRALTILSRRSEPLVSA